MCVAGKGCRHICTVSASQWCLLSYVQEYNVAFSPRISVITAETACNCQRFSKIIRRDKLWITVIIKLDWCHWTATAGRCFHRFFADTVSVSACLSGSFSSLGEQERPVGCLPADWQRLRRDLRVKGDGSWRRRGERTQTGKDPSLRDN